METINNYLLEKILLYLHDLDFINFIMTCKKYYYRQYRYIFTKRYDLSIIEDEYDVYNKYNFKKILFDYNEFHVEDISKHTTDIKFDNTFNYSIEVWPDH